MNRDFMTFQNKTFALAVLNAMYDVLEREDMEDLHSDRGLGEKILDLIGYIEDLKTN